MQLDIIFSKIFRKPKIFCCIVFFILTSCLSEESIEKENISRILPPVKVFVKQGIETRVQIDLSKISPQEAIRKEELDSYQYTIEPPLPKGVYLSKEAKFQFVVSRDAEKLENRIFQLTISVPEDHRDYKGVISTVIDMSVVSVSEKTISGNIEIEDTIKSFAGEKKKIVMDFLKTIKEGDKEADNYFFIIKKKNNGQIPKSIIFNSEGISFLSSSKVNDSGTYILEIKANNFNSFVGQIDKEITITIDQSLVKGELSYPNIAVPLTNRLSASSIVVKKITPAGAKNVNSIFSVSDSSPSLPAGISINSSTGQVSLSDGVAVGSNTYEIQANFDSDNYQGIVRGKISIDVYKAPELKNTILSSLLMSDKKSFAHFSGFQVNSVDNIIQIKITYSKEYNLEIKYREESQKTNSLKKKQQFNQTFGTVSKVDYSYNSNENRWLLEGDFSKVESQTILNSLLVRNVEGKDLDIKINFINKKGHSLTNDFIYSIKYLPNEFFVAATNITSTTADIVYFTGGIDWDSHKIYISSEKPETIAEVERGTLKKTVTDDSLLQKVVGLNNYSKYYVSVISEKNSRKVLTGVYGFITGAKLYWDSTVSQIATNRIGHWFNIASSGADYDGVIGNSGADFSYNSADKTFDNNAAGKKITFTELTDVRAAFLVADITYNRSVILGHKTQVPQEMTSRNNQMVPDYSVANKRINNGKFWLGGASKTRTEFLRQSSMAVYGIWADISKDATAVKSDMTSYKDNNSYNWRGKYQKSI